jgi:hypothetical protein
MSQQEIKARIAALQQQLANDRSFLALGICHRILNLEVKLLGVRS